MAGENLFPATTRVIRGLLAKLHGQTFGGDRDLYDVCGYPDALEPQDYVGAYLRGGIAARIIDAFPDATWRERPVIKATAEDDQGEDGEFAQAVNRLLEQYTVWDTLHRLDLLSALGHYGVLLFGVAGGEPPHQPLNDGRQRLLYLSPHGERSAEITRWENRPSNPRFAKPFMYRITVGVNWKGVGGAETSINVHWTRVLHVTEKALDDGAIGTPRLERVWNRLLDLDKLLGGSAEVYWQNAAPIRTWSADSEAQWDPEAQSDMESQFQELRHNLRKDLRLQGVTGDQLMAEPADPSNHIDKQLDVIAGSVGIPKRILIGSERGELSSEQDENNWAGRIAERREQHATPKILRPLIDRFIAFGLLPQPAGGYTVEWPESDALGEEKRAEIAKSKAEAVQLYSSVPSAELIIPPQEFRRWLGEAEISEFEPPDNDLGGVDGEVDEGDPNAVVTFANLKAQAQARTLYVRRNVLNADEVRAWAKAQGFETVVPADDMHVTIAFSRTPVDWIEVGDAWHGDSGELVIPPGGPRVVEPLGDSAIVLMFASHELAWRHEDIKRAGASWDWPSYQPHITITYDGDPQLRSELARGERLIEPYRGEIRLGPEIFEEVREDWSDGVVENRSA